ncbi:MAG: hypothetical protein JWO89_1885 [Verrucomicrobiaceae bacterium]|nr:hypothetical protein [Verrucomicrobiaceae bacterium]
MNRLLPFLFLPVLAMAQQGQPDPVLARMRDAMKKLTVRITEAESQMAAAQAAQIAAEAQVKELGAKLEAASKQLKELTGQAAADKEAAEKKAADLEAKIALRDKDNETLTTSLTKWKQGYAQLENVAKTTEAKRSALDTQVIQLQRRVEDRETKNRELYRLGNEILDRYKNFGLGNALAAREPFTGISKVKLQTLVQDYGDKLADQTLRAGKQ